MPKIRIYKIEGMESIDFALEFSNIVRLCSFTGGDKELSIAFRNKEDLDMFMEEIIKEYESYTGKTRMERWEEKKRETEKRFSLFRWLTKGRKRK